MSSLPRHATCKFPGGNLGPFLQGVQPVRRRVRRSDATELAEVLGVVGSLGAFGNPVAQEDPRGQHVWRRTLNTRVNDLRRPISRRAGLHALQDIYPRGFL